MHRDQFVSTVVANLPLCRDHYKLIFRLDAFPPTEPGQFIQVSCRDLDITYADDRELNYLPDQPLQLRGPEIASPLAFIRRPFSLAGRRDTAGGCELEIIHRVVGVGTEWLSQLKPNDTLHILGPLGNTFALPPENSPAILIGGGVGIPPMLYLAEHLHRHNRKAVAFAGALTIDLLPLTITADAPTPTATSFDPLYNIAEFARYNTPAVISTDDGSYGYRGFITQALEQYLDAFFSSSDTKPTLYTCGPEPMMKRIADIAHARNIPCQIAVERAMACGMGTCQSCCIKVRKPDPSMPPLPGKPWSYKLACTDGPVFQSADLLW
jgi:dihydroorotate dehydrogenase electron transfer subunit